jgi:hypothetical protein
MPGSLGDRLIENGCSIPLADFQNQLAAIMAEMYRTWSVDELLLHPSEGLEFCAVVRRQTNCRDLPEDLILRCLLNRRKNP